MVAFLSVWACLPVFRFRYARQKNPLKPLPLVPVSSRHAPQPIWESVRASKPDAVLLGDNIYGDTRDMEKLKSRWATFGAFPEFKKLRSDCRLLAIWDDHDYGENDAGREFPQKAESQQIFLDFLGEPKDSERRKTPGIYDSVTIGPKGKRVQFILLDTRYFRSPLKRAAKREKGKGPYGRTNRIRQKFSAKPNGSGWRKLCANRPKSASSHPVFKLSQPLTAGKPGETFPKNGNAFSIC